MNYELAKKLKEAGWPQHIGELKAGIYDGEYYAFPNLEELIEAIGDGNLTIIRTRKGKKWSCYMKDEEGTTVGVIMNYGTLIEALANLYLELHK